MSLLESSYKRPTLFFSKHIETIYPVVFRDVSDLTFVRERFELEDGDFLDIDWIRNNNSKLLILSHGLEGSTSSVYLKGFARAASNAGYDLLAWNYRGCSGEINRNFRFYHSGESKDLEIIVNYALTKKEYEKLGLVGFSVGGNITLKYLGEINKNLSPRIKAAVSFSAPCDLYAGAQHMAKRECSFYMNRFLKSLHIKVKSKMLQFPDKINDKGFFEIKDFIEFDERYTAPIHGFKGARDYYEKCSSINFIPSISTPTLLVSALNDPFLAKACYPFEQAQNHSFLQFEAPKHGGHCGFYKSNQNGNYWSDNRALEFLSTYL